MLQPWCKEENAWAVHRLANRDLGPDPKFGISQGERFVAIQSLVARGSEKETAEVLLIDCRSDAVTKIN